MPLYGEAKVVLLAWLVLPHFKGATWVYETIIGPGSAKLRAELHKIPALERLWNQEDATSVKVGSDLIDSLQISVQCAAFWPWLAKDSLERSQCKHWHCKALVVASAQ